MADKSHLSLVGSTSPENMAGGHHSEEKRSYPRGGSGGGGDDMQQRVRELEKDVQSIKTDLAVIRSNYATKEDVSNAKNSIIMWVVGAVIFAQLIPALPNILVAINKLLSS